MKQKRIEITANGLEQLKKELKEITVIKRPIVLDKLHKARSMGDLSENSAYTTAREEQSMLEGRIMEIQYILKNAAIVNVSKQNRNIQLGSKPTVRINGTDETMEIVGEFESDPLNKKLSATSPIGKALLGRKKGDTVEIRIPSGTITYTILNVD